MRTRALLRGGSSQHASDLDRRARKHVAEKRGGGARAITFDELIAGDRPHELIALDEGLVALATFDERKARAIELHYFGGLTRTAPSWRPRAVQFHAVDEGGFAAGVRVDYATAEGGAFSLVVPAAACGVVAR